MFAGSTGIAWAVEPGRFANEVTRCDCWYNQLSAPTSVDTMGRNISTTRQDRPDELTIQKKEAACRKEGSLFFALRVEESKVNGGSTNLRH